MVLVTYVVGHVGQAADPVRRIELGVTPPGVSVVAGAAPLALGHVVVEEDVDLLLLALGGDGIVDLWPVSLAAANDGMIDSPRDGWLLP